MCLFAMTGNVFRVLANERFARVVVPCIVYDRPLHSPYTEIFAQIFARANCAQSIDFKWWAY